MHTTVKVRHCALMAVTKHTSAADTLPYCLANRHTRCPRRCPFAEPHACTGSTPHPTWTQPDHVHTTFILHAAVLVQCVLLRPSFAGYVSRHFVRGSTGCCADSSSVFCADTSSGCWADAASGLIAAESRHQLTHIYAPWFHTSNGMHTACSLLN